MLYHPEKLQNVDCRLVELVTEYGKSNNCLVVCGYRTKEEQDIAYRNGNSRAKWPQSAHNKTPSRAVDLAPCNDKGQIDWRDTESFKVQAAQILKLSNVLNIKLIWGGNFKKIIDLPHFELIQ